jgi:hypothetical protein
VAAVVVLTQVLEEVPEGIGRQLLDRSLDEILPLSQCFPYKHQPLIP